VTGGVSTRTPAERFWEKVNKTGDCWLWTAACQKNGYGSFYLEGKRVGAHRVVWEFERGPIPAGMVPDHTCLVKSCVNPDHLVLVTHGKNTALHYDPAEHLPQRSPAREQLHRWARLARLP